MKTEKQKMLASELYNPLDPELCRDRERCREICRKLNKSGEGQERAELLAQLFGRETDVWLEPPFYCDYGTNIILGKNVFFNFNCVVLDVGEVHIGDNVFIGPAVQIYAVNHPMDAVERRSMMESSKPVTIGSDVWIGGGAILCPGVTVGDRVVIAAGSVVTRDVPEDVLVGGNPARIIRKLQSPS